METLDSEMMDAIEKRHSVRSYKTDKLPEDIRARLQEKIDECNAESGLSIRLVCDEPNAFDSTLAHYGNFSNVFNYIVMAGSDSPDLDVRCGYQGERLVLLAQELGLNTCWVALTFKKRYVRSMLAPGEKLSIVIAIGYGTTQGKPRKSKSVTQVSKISSGSEVPSWFENGVRLALLAPTAMNQQSFELELAGKDSSGKSVVRFINKGGAYSKSDEGIVRLHFELGAGRDNFVWAN